MREQPEQREDARAEIEKQLAADHEARLLAEARRRVERRRSMAQLEVTVAQPAYWLEHLDELLDGLRQARKMWPLVRDESPDFVLGERIETPGPDDVVITHLEWWLQHRDELEATLREAVAGDSAE